MEQLLVLAVLFILITTSCALAQPVTVQSLLEEQVDFERLATQPEVGRDSDQWSSYDRASVSPDAEGWFANGDAGQFIRTEERNGETEYVMAEMTGPGAIVRLWSANPDGAGIIRIYIDDMTRPALEADFLALTTAQVPEFPAPFSGRRALGANLYFPFPYAHQCKVTASKPGFYYHVGYTTFPQGTEVEPFNLEAFATLGPTLLKVGRLLENPTSGFNTRGAKRVPVRLTIQPGKSAILADLKGPAAICQLTMNVEVDDPNLKTLLRETALSISFDEEAAPCVWAPLGDFFGSTPGINPYQSLPLGMAADGGAYSNWYMPFGKQAKIEVKNESKFPLELAFSTYWKPIKWTSDLMYFHAGWRSEWFPVEPAFLDWRMLDATGPGRFVGVMLGVTNTAPGWWGEGDEKVWVDGDTFPSFFGTGSEDYFGYAWCNPELFTHAMHNQSICTGPGNFGYTAVARFHIADDIPFQQRIRFDIEKWDAAERGYCCTSYWYAAPGATSFFKPVPVNERRLWPLKDLNVKIKGALEGEELEIVSLTGGTTSIQALTAEGFSNMHHLWWRDAGVGGELVVAVPVAKPGKHWIIVNLTKSWDYGIFQLSVDGKPVGDPVDLYSAVIAPEKLDLGVFTLGKSFKLGLKCVGINELSNPKSYMAGLDYILLEPVE